MQDVLYGPMISQRFADNFEKWLGEIQPHHRTSGSSALGRITSDSPRDGFVGDPDAGIFEHPVIVDGVTLDDALYRNETFGPIAPVATFDTFDEALTLANAHGYGLSSSIYTTRPEHAFRFREGVTAGMVSVNNSTSGAEAHLPFGGNGKSGNGARQSGRVDARPGDPLAVDELGLLRQAAEGADGRRESGPADLPRRSGSDRSGRGGRLRGGRSCLPLARRPLGFRTPPCAPVVCGR
jgi:hypothetical protein